ncbi:aldo/keto reductase [Propionibacteriaceae bacterium G1746]
MEHGVKLSSGQVLPPVTFGTWKLDDTAAELAVRDAATEGYRAFDTGQRYHNEAGVGAGMRTAPVPRDQLMVTTKLRGGDHGAEQAERAFKASLRNLGLDYIDLYLIHWPLPRLGLYVETWQALRELRDQGLIRTIGVSNFTAEHIDALIAATGEAPAVNQVECHVGWRQDALRQQMADRGVVVQSWGAIGRGKGLLEDGRLQQVAAQHGVSPAQVAMRWAWQQGVPVIAKSGNPERRRQNLDLDSFVLTGDDMALLATFDQVRIGKDPDVDEEY